MPSAPASPFGLVVCAMQPLGHCVAASPTNAYLMSWPRIEPCVCQPQYCEQKPELALTSGPVSTKYTPFVSVGLVSATICWICASDSDVPYVSEWATEPEKCTELLTC